MELDIQKNVLKFMNGNIIRVLDIPEDSTVLTLFKQESGICQEINNVVKNCTNISKIEELKSDTKFKYILFELDGYLKENYASILQKLKEYLEQDGKLIILATNCFGIKYFCGGNYNENTRAFDTITKRKLGIGRKKINNLLEELGFKSINFYYPFPDYEYTNVIFSDKYIPNTNMSKLMYNLHYEEGSRIVFNEHDALKNIIVNDEFKTFANAFLIVTSLKENDDLDFKFASFNNLRKEDYRLVTKMYDTYVKKYAINEKSTEHLNRIKNNIDTLNELGFNLLDSYNENSIISKYANNEVLNEVITKTFQEEDLDKGISIIKNWYDFVFNSLMKIKSEEEETIFEKFNIEIGNEQKGKLNFIEKGLLDLVFENTFIIDNQYYFYDQEWNYKNTPIEFILYRAINNLYLYSSKLEEIISYDEMLSKFDILEFKDTFANLEKCIQDDLADREVLEKFWEFYSYKDDPEEKDNFIKEQKKYIEHLLNTIEIDRKENERLCNELNSIYNSRSWKLIKKINSFRKK